MLELIIEAILKLFCKSYTEELEEEEGFPNKKDRIVQHFKKCPNFVNKTTAEERAEIFKLLEKENNDAATPIIPVTHNKRLCKYIFKLHCYLEVIYNNFYFFLAIDSSQESVSHASQSFVTPSHKVVVCSSYGPMDNFIAWSLSKEDLKKFYILLLRLTFSCGWALSWVNNPEAKELFNFLNPLLKLPDHRLLGGDILKEAVKNVDEIMDNTLKEDQVGVTLTFDGWTNVKNEQLLGTVLITSEGRPFVWRAVDISSERENYTNVMEKTELMLNGLKDKEIIVCAVVTDSASAYAAARYVY